MAVEGVDVASHQGSVSWPDVAAHGHAFAWTKATGGAWYRNPTFADNWHGIKAAGLQRGAYSYAFESSGQPFPGPGPEVEAQYFLDAVVAQGLGPTDMLALDIEEGPADIDLADWALRWLRYVETSVGFRPLCYTGRWFTEQHDFWARSELAAYPLWLAAYQQAMPAPPAPWERVVFWQHTDRASVPGIATPCDLNLFNGSRELLAEYGKPASSVPVEPIMPPQTPTLPVYDPTYAAFSQNDDWSCCPTSTRWMLHAYGRRPSEQWLESSMLADGIVTTQYGLMNASGGGVARWITEQYSEHGYLGENDGAVTFDQVAEDAATRKHPLMIGGRNWGAGGHWSGVRGFEGDKLLLANPASGYGGVTQTMSRQQWSSLGPFSMVRLVHPAAEAAAPGVPTTPPPEPTDPYAPWRGSIGSGLLSAMQADGTLPAQRSSTWLPLGVNPSDVEEAYGQNGVRYYWLLGQGQGFKQAPS
jgi:GH25 family lysozyme M1 (1,4-beta-N-acetylmuramidase)